MTAEQVKKWLIPRLISGNLAIWTVLALEKVILYCFWVPREINLRFCSKTQWPDVSVGFRPLCWCPSGWASTWRLHTNLYTFGEKASPHILHKKNCCDPKLGKSLCIVTFFLSSDSGLYLQNGFYFYFENQQLWLMGVHGSWLQL